MDCLFVITRPLAKVSNLLAQGGVLAAWDGDESTYTIGQLYKLRSAIFNQRTVIERLNRTVIRMIEQ